MRAALCASFVSALTFAFAAPTLAQVSANPYDDAEAGPISDEVPDADTASDDDPRADSRADADALSEAGGDPGAETVDGPIDEVDAGSDAGPPAEPPHWTDARVAGWTTFAASLAVAIGGVIVFAVGLDDINAVETAPFGSDWGDFAASRERAPLLTGAGLAIAAIGAVGTAVGAGLLAFAGEGGTWLTVSALPGGVTVRGAF